MIDFMRGQCRRCAVGKITRRRLRGTSIAVEQIDFDSAELPALFLVVELHDDRSSIISKHRARRAAEKFAGKHARRS